MTDPALRQARDGQIRLTPATTRKVIRALRRWAKTCAELADRLEAALKDEKAKEGGR